MRAQWDPDRSLTGERLARRAIQVGLSGEAVHRYCDEWVRSITDITALTSRVGQLADAARELPAELVYPLGPALAQRIGAEPGHPASADGAR